MADAVALHRTLGIPIADTLAMDPRASAALLDHLLREREATERDRKRDEREAAARRTDTPSS